MEPDAYISVLRPGSPEDQALESVLKKAPPVRLTANTTALHLHGVAALSRLSALLKGHVFALLLHPWALQCGSKTGGPPCIWCIIKTLLGLGAGGGPIASSGPAFPTGPSGLGTGGGPIASAGPALPGGPPAQKPLTAAGPAAGDPVNLSTLAEGYASETDLTVYNPHGPSVQWGRTYNSLRGPDNTYSIVGTTYQCDDFGFGWNSNYSTQVVDGNPSARPQLLVSHATILTSTGTDHPGGGLTWDVRYGGSTVGSSSTTNGWTVTHSGFSSSMTVTPPSGATSGTGYEVRLSFGTPGGTSYISVFFDVLTIGQAPISLTSVQYSNGTDACGAGLSWDIQSGGSTIASSAHPAGWSADFFTMGSYFTVTPPWTAATGSGYEVRTKITSGISATFSVIATRLTAAAGTRYLEEPNGAEFAFSAASVPTSGSPVQCTGPAGVPILLEWDYDGSPLGYYTITLEDRTKLVTTDGSKSIVPQTWNTATANSVLMLSDLAAQYDRVGNELAFGYGGSLPDSGFPALTSLVDASTSTTLLTLTRATDGTGNVTAASDVYCRSVYYHDSAYATTNIPVYYQSYQEVDQVSELVTTGTPSPPVRWAYGYTDIDNGETNMMGAEEVPFLTSITVPSPTGSGTSTSTINYDASTDCVTSIVDGNSNTVSFTVVDGSHTKVTVKNSASALAYSYTAGFDSNGSETSLTDGTNSTVVESFVYSDPNDPYRPSSYTDGDSRVCSMTWDQYGNIQTFTTPKSTETVYTWSYTNFALGELTSEQEGSKTATSYTYYEPSGLIYTVNTPVPGTSSSGTTVTYTAVYSTLGNLTSITGPGNGTVSTITTTLNYTTDGMYTQSEALGQPVLITDNLSKSTHVRYTSMGEPNVQVDAVGNEVDTSFDIAGNPATVTYPATDQSGMGHSYTTYAYQYPDGPLVTESLYDESAALFQQVSYTYGYEGELLTRTGSTEPVTLSYDAAYRTVSLEDGNSHTTSYSFNTAGYPSEITFPGSDTVQYTSYANSGRLLQREDGNSVITNYSYADTDGMLSAIAYPAYASLNASLSYDGYDRCTSSSDGAGSYSYGYDDRDVLTTNTTTYTGLAGKTISYTFNNDGSRAGMSTPAGSFSYIYDGNGRLGSLANPFSETSGWSYLDNGWLNTQTLGNGAVTTDSYNGLGELTDLLNQDNMGNTLSEFSSLVYNASGSRTSGTAALTGVSSLSGTLSWGYDSKDELTSDASSRNGSYSHSFSYDSAGNPTTWMGGTKTFNSDNQDSANSYDGNGNPTTYGGITVTYDPENRMTAFGSALTAGYQADGLRAWKDGSSQTYFLYDGETPVVELNSSGTVIATNTFGVAGLLSRRISGTSTFYQFDPQGGAAQRLDSSCSVTSSTGFDGWGNTVGAVGSDPFQYGAQWGYYTDSETGLSLLTHRYYDPTSGRFLNRDPLGDGVGINVYGYCGSDPATEMDPNGTDGVIAWPVSWAGGGEAGELGGEAAAGGPVGWILGGTVALSYGGYYLGKWIGGKLFPPGGELPPSQLFAKGVKRIPSPTLRRDWEKKNNLSWPKCPDNLGRNQDVSHKIPLADGGSDTTDNIEPEPGPVHRRRHSQNGDSKRWGGIRYK